MPPTRSGPGAVGAAGARGNTRNEIRRPGRGGALRLAWDSRWDTDGNRIRREPLGWTAWDRKFLAQIARYPLPLSRGQIATLRWIVSRAA
jgi:hypothetical protein